MKNKNTITLNGKVSTEITGLIIQELAPISKPLIRSEIEEIDGRDGDVVTTLGYSAYDKEVTIGLYGAFDINEVIAYFDSEGTVIFSNEPDQYYNYQILDQIDFERLVRFRTATVTFHIQPFKYSALQGNLILDPPATNLLSFSDYTSTSNGVTLTATDGVVNISGKPTAATEFYLPINSLTVNAGSYTLSATASGTNPNYCSIRLIGSAPSDADSFGNKYITLAQGTVTLQDTLADSDTYGYLWFYMNPGQTFNFDVTFAFENNAEKSISGEGTELALLNTAEAPFSQFTIKGNTQQATYSGKNLLPVTGFNYSSGGLTSTNNGSTVNISGTTSIQYATITSQTALGATIPSGTAITLSMTSALPAGVRLYMRIYGAEGSSYSNLAIEDGGTSISTTLGRDFGRYQFLIYSTVGTTLNISNLGIQIETGSTATSFEPYVGGTPSPNPDYPQEIMVVKNQEMIRLTGKNLASADELSLLPTVERVSGGLRATISSDTLVTYYAPFRVLPAGTYTISFDARSANADTTLLTLASTAYIWGQSGLALKDKDGEAADAGYRRLTKDWKRFSFTATLPTSAPWIGDLAMTLFFDTFTNSPIFELQNFQIEFGAEATEFDGSVPQNIPIDLRTGKNLLSTDFFSMGALMNGMPVSSILYRINNALAPIRVKPNTTYTISAGLVSPVLGMMVDVQQCAANFQYVQSSGWKQLATGNYTFTTGSNIYYIMLSFGISTTSTTVTEGSTEDTTAYSSASQWLRGTTLQVEEGAATTYEPYESMELCKIGDYQDYVLKSGDDWYVHKAIGKVVFNGTETWGRTNISAGDSRFYVSVPGIQTTTSPDKLGLVISNKLIENSNYEQFNLGTQGIRVRSNGAEQIIMYINATKAMSVNDFKIWLASNNIIAYYALATPTDTKITTEFTIEQLNNLKEYAHTYRGVTFLSSLPGGSTILAPIVAVETVKQIDGEVINSGNTTAKPKLTIYGEGDIGVNLNGIQIFQIALGENGYITIDTAAMEAYQDTTETLMNRLVTGDYNNFALNPGTNEITFSGTVTQCIVENYSRWI